MKLQAIVINCLILLILIPKYGSTFDKPISLKTHGENSPYILNANNFSLNARNVKALKSQGNMLWIGTSRGVIKYNKSSKDDYVIYDNQNGLLSNGIFTIILCEKINCN